MTPESVIARQARRFVWRGQAFLPDRQQSGRCRYARTGKPIHQTQGLGNKAHFPMAGWISDWLNMRCVSVIGLTQK
jgi:hypothetical protein